MNNQKFSSRMAAASGSSILAGAILFALDARAGATWARSSFATGLSIGAGFALIGFVFGILVGRTSRAMAQLGAQLQGKPTSEQLLQMQKIQKQQATYSTLSTITLILAVVFMAIARYM
jgi:Na+/glutamate symporter